jgi:hypothetical protein
MGHPDVASVDIAALLAAARQYDDIAELLDDTVRHQLSGLSFGGAGAGRMYVARGEAVRSGVDAVVVALREWARAVAEIASMLRDAADRYVDADSRATRRVG